MFERFKEYLTFGAGRPPGTMWLMEKAYFDLRRRYPGKTEYAYIRLALQSRYPDKTNEVQRLASECQNLDDAIVAAIGIDFGYAVAFQIRTNVLPSHPPCSRCGKYRALSTIDDLCYGCRKYGGFAACVKCHCYWEDAPEFCQRCGEKLWRITDGPGVPMGPVHGAPGQAPARTQNVSEPAQDRIPSDIGENSGEFERLATQIDDLEARCAKVWDTSVQQRREYRRLRRMDAAAARQFTAASTIAGTDDPSLVQDLDRFFDSLCLMYLGGNSERRDEIRGLMGTNKRLLGNLYGYAGRAASRLKQTGSPEFLLRGLAAISIDDDRSCQTFGFVLGQLYRNATEHALDAAGFFKTVAALSAAAAKHIIGTFEQSEDFSLFVSP